MCLNSHSIIYQCRNYGQRKVHVLINVTEYWIRSVEKIKNPDPYAKKNNADPNESGSGTIKFKHIFRYIKTS